MQSFQFTIFFALAIACGFQASTSTAFTAMARCQKPDATTLIGSKRNGKHYQQKGRLPIRSLNVLDSSPDPDMPDDEVEGGPSMSLPTPSAQPEITPPAYVPPPPKPTRKSPAAVRQQQMDPLMASLTADNSETSPDQPTQNIPLFGEIPADGTLNLLVPAVVFGILGFIYSFVIAFNSSDQIVDSLMQAGKSVNPTSRSYDKNVCRGLCSSQEKDVDGMRNFMEAITRNARESE
jgi:hypothetical protein